MKKSKAAFPIAVSVLITGLSSTGALAHMEPKIGEDMEQCYGIVKAGKNDCASADGKHACAGLAAEDGNPHEWIKLPAGLCEKIVGGALNEEEAEKVRKETKHNHSENSE